LQASTSTRTPSRRRPRARSPVSSAATSTAGSSDRRRAKPGTTRLYLSGSETKLVAGLFADTIIDTVVVSEDPDAASAVKMTFAAWTKGASALLLAIRALARAEGVEETLLEEWRTSQPHLVERSVAAARSALGKGWRWVGEMNEIAETFAAAGLPDGFHRAAAEV
jgi:nucleotide-binding universal stress UspA family protein